MGKFIGGVVTIGLSISNFRILQNYKFCEYVNFGAI